MQTLTAHREKETTGIYAGFIKTILKNEAGEIVATFPAGNRQPSRRGKTIVHNCARYHITWQDTTQESK